MFRAVVRITGAGRLADFRERLRWLMIQDLDAEDYTEHHAEGVLEYRFEPRHGIPFPAFTSASADFPELRVEAQWDHDGRRGRAVIENGRLTEQAPELADETQVDVEVDDKGRLVLAMVVQRQPDAFIGYAATAERHSYFRHAGKLELVDTGAPDEALEEVAFAFVDAWIWYDEEEAPLERARYATYGYAVRGANIRSEKLALLRQSDYRHSTLDADAKAVRDALAAEWLKTA